MPDYYVLLCISNVLPPHPTKSLPFSCKYLKLTHFFLEMLSIWFFVYDKICAEGQILLNNGCHCAHVRMCLREHVSVCMRVLTSMCMWSRACVQRMRVCMHEHVSTCLCTHVHVARVHMCLYWHMWCTRMWACVCKYIFMPVCLLV